ncbi:putative membrane protein [Mesorhizobium robiniae]|uniref:Membrane protein n=1 Tax=Mesorhizobium robiniae TaxID=559315 RepID=A0ABV2GN75_9HYPH
MASYSSRVRADIARWLQAGLIDAPTADALTRDVEANQRRSLSFGSILAMMAALLFGAAVLIFVAANWEAIPRLARVAALFAIIIAGYVGGAVLKARDHAALGEALWIVAAAAFGGSIALIGQMYHLSGDEASALITWGAGTALAAVALRSNPLTVAAVGIADAWLVLTGFDYFRHTEFPHLFVVMAIVLFAISFWTRSQVARHLIVLSIIFYLVLLVIHYDTLQVAIPLVVASALLFAAAIFAAGPVDRLVQLGGRLPLHALIGFLTGLAMTQLELADESNNGGFAIASAIALAGIVAAIVLGGRESRGLRWAAYAGFAFELAIIYVVMLQSMLDTAGFFLAAAVLLGILAFVILRIERRMRAPSAEGAAA